MHDSNLYININEEKTIRYAFEKIKSKFGILITIIDKSGKLKGVITEGDLRRSLLKGYSLETQLKIVMNKVPVYITSNQLNNEGNKNDIINRLNKLYPDDSYSRKYILIPIVDDKMIVKGAISFDELISGTYLYKIKKNKIPAKILVVGGAGYIGSVLVRALLKKGYMVKVLDNFVYNQDSLDKINSDYFKRIKGDAIDTNTLIKAISNVDAVVYLAEIVGDPACALIPETAFKTNFLSVNSMASLCSYLNINRFIYTSSCSVYGASKDPDNFLTESSSVNPVSHYGRMKLMSEHAILNQVSQNFSPTILRLSTVFGVSNRSRFDLVVNLFAKNAYFYKELNVFGGEQWRPNVHVKDVSKAIISVLNSKLEIVGNRIYNIGNKKNNLKIIDVAYLAKEIFPKVKININKSEKDNRNYKVSFDKYEKEVDSFNYISVKEGYRELYNFFKNKLIKNPENKIYYNIKFWEEYNNENSKS